MSYLDKNVYSDNDFAYNDFTQNLLPKSELLINSILKLKLLEEEWEVDNGILQGKSIQPAELGMTRVADDLGLAIQQDLPNRHRPYMKFRSGVPSDITGRFNGKVISRSKDACNQRIPGEMCPRQGRSHFMVQ